MTPARLSAQKPMRVSFSRLLLTRMIRERWQIRPVLVELDDEGRGRLVYRIGTAERELHAIILSDKLAPADQSDRAIATRWDLALAVVEGPVDDARIERILQAPPRDGGSGADPRVGRVDALTLLWVCANRSSRIFDHTVDRLASGHQPDLDVVGSASYLMRGINYVANGMMGTRMLDAHEPGHPLRSPYFAQMLGCYLVREVSCELVDAIARRRSARAVTLDESIRSYVGVGNSTGIGLGLMVNRHPILIDRWIRIRETALAEARGRSPGPRDAARLMAVLDRCIRYRAEDPTDPGFFVPSAAIALELDRMRGLVTEYQTKGTMAGAVPALPWDRLCELVGPQVSAETEETMHSLLVEIYPDIADALAPGQMLEEAYDLAPERTVGELRAVVEADYRWALRWDLSRSGERYWLWYRTAAGGEPRVTPYSGDPEERARNVALDLVADVQALASALATADPGEPVGLLAARRPDLRAVIERVQSVEGLTYHSPVMNMLAQDFVPIHLGRFVLWALKGMEKPSPRNNIWIRGVMMQGAPTGNQIAAGTTDDWVYPARPAVG